MNTNYFLDLTAGNMFGTKKSPAIPAKYYIGLSSTAPNIGGSNVTEPSDGAGYKRVELNNLGAPEDGVVSNTSAIDFPESTSAWGTMTHFVIYDAPSGGNLLMYDELTIKRSVEQATIMTIKTGSLKLSVLNPA